MDCKEIICCAKDIIQTLSGVLACIIAWIIPKRIMWMQAYSGLLSDYRSAEFAGAVQSVVEFFVLDCGGDYSRIPQEYKKRFLKDFYVSDEALSLEGKSLMEIRALVESGKIKVKTDSPCLHFQRRLLGQFYFQLNLCAKSPFVGMRRVCRDFTSNEVNIIKILYLMNNAIDGDEILMKDTSFDFRVPRIKVSKGVNKYLSSMSLILRKSKRFVEI